MSSLTVPSLEDVEALSRRAVDAGRDMARRRSEIDWSEKGPRDFVSEADLALETLIRGDIQARFGEVPVVGEEQGGALSEDRSGWVIDPIDGTSNFLLGLPIWGMSIGYLFKGEAVAGALCFPELDLRLVATSESGLHRNGGCIKPDGHRATAIPTLALGENDHEPGADTDRRAQALRAEGYDVVRYRCSSFALASTALGRLSGYVESGTKLWDVVAGAAVCQAAGLTVAYRDIGSDRLSIDVRW